MGEPMCDGCSDLRKLLPIFPLSFIRKSVLTNKCLVLGRRNLLIVDAVLPVAKSRTAEAITAILAVKAKGAINAMLAALTEIAIVAVLAV